MPSRKKRMTKRERIAQIRRRVCCTTAAIVLCIGLVLFCSKSLKSLQQQAQQEQGQQGESQQEEIPQDQSSDSQLEQNRLLWEAAPPMDVQLLTPNEWSRPQLTLRKVNGVVIHYTGNPGTTAQQNRDYFEDLMNTHITKASSHFIIGLEGEIIQCIPSSEWAYTSNQRNKDTLSIECCHPDESGKFNDATYQSMVELTGWLCRRFGLSSADVIRHYDVTGKECPKYFVDHTDAWEQFLRDVQAYADQL